MATFTPQQLAIRQQILNSHTNFGNFLDSDIINKLINLFDNGDIIKYIKDERTLRGLNNIGVSIKSVVFGTKDNKSTILLEIKKNNKVLVHISIHLIANQLSSKNAGLIHFYKNIHKKVLKANISKKPLLYALIKVEKSVNKPHSLEFSIANGYTTNQSIKNAIKYDSEIQQEMDVIITVLNRLFDEKNKDFYVGNTNKLIPIHNQTNNILQNINNHSTLTMRKNKGVKMLPTLSQDPPLPMVRSTRATTRKVTRRNLRNVHRNNLEEVNINTIHTND